MSDKPYQVEVTLKHPRAVVSAVRLDPGHSTPEHAHADDYVVSPRAATTVVKTNYKDGAKHSEETIEHRPGEPYFVAANEDGITFTLKNIGAGPMLCDKTFIKPK